RGRADPVRQVELPRPGADRAPGADQLAVSGEPVDAAVAVAVGDVQLPGGRDREVGAPVERPGRPPHGLHVVHDRAGAGCVPGVGGRPRGAERLQQLPVRAEPAHGVVAAVDAVDGAVGGDGEPVRLGEHPVAPRGAEGAVAVEHEHALAVAGEQVDLVVPANVGARDDAVGELGRHPLPGVGRLEPEVGRGAHRAAPGSVAGSQPHGWGPQPGGTSSPARMVWTGTMPCSPVKLALVVSTNVNSPRTTSSTVRSASRPTAIAPISSCLPIAAAACPVVIATTSAKEYPTAMNLAMHSTRLWKPWPPAVRSLLMVSGCSPRSACSRAAA